VTYASSHEALGDDSGAGPGPGSVCDSQRQDLIRALDRLRDTVLKSAAIGMCLRGGLHTLSVLLSQLSRRKRQSKRSGAHLQALALDTLQFASFLAAFGGTYVAVDEGLGQCIGKERSKAWRAAVAGACAGPTILIMGWERPPTCLHSAPALILFPGPLLCSCTPLSLALPKSVGSGRTATRDSLLTSS